MELKKNQLANLGMFKTTRGNAITPLEIKQWTRVGNRAIEIAEAVIKRIATKESYIKKYEIQT